MSEQAIDLIVCPDCGAGNAPGDRRCWLCQYPLDHVAGAARPGSGLTSTGQAVLMITLAVAAMTYVLLCIGVWQEAPGLAIGLAAIVVPPLVATAVASFRGRQLGRPLGLGEKALKFVTWFSIFLGLIGLAALAASIAFFFWCLSAIAQNS